MTTARNDSRPARRRSGPRRAAGLAGGLVLLLLKAHAFSTVLHARQRRHTGMW